MASKREQVLQALKALIVAALPDADVRRNPDKAERITPGGLVSLYDGDPGDPEIDLSPLTYNYEHRIAIEVAVYESASKTREQVLDELLQPIGAAIAADRFLGGLCDFVEAVAPTTADIEALGAETGRSADLIIVASYATADPLT